MKYALITAMLSLATANAANIIAVLEITPSNDETSLSIAEYRHLTDELRTKARETLPPEYTILTRDNIFQLLPPDEKEAECLAQSCAVDIGRTIGAEYVTQGFVGKFEKKLTLTVELYESMSGNMLSSFVTESDNASGLLEAIRKKAPTMFARISPTSIPTNIPAMQKKSFWVAIGLDVLGATAIGLGIYNNAKASDYYRESKKLLEKPDNPQYKDYKNAFDSKQKKMKNAENARNIFYATGGALLLGGVALHIWF